MPETPTTSTLNLLEVNTRAKHARHIITGFSHSRTPTLADLWHQVNDALSDIPVLTTEITRPERLADGMPASTAPTLRQPGGSPSPRITTASPTRSATCGTSCTPRALAPAGGTHDQSLAGCAATPAGCAATGYSPWSSSTPATGCLTWSS